MNRPPVRREGSGIYINLLAGLTILAGLGLSVVVGLLLLGPGLVPAFLAPSTPSLAPPVAFTARPTEFPTALPSGTDSPLVQTAAAAQTQTAGVTPTVIEVNPSPAAVSGGITVNAQVSDEGGGLRLRQFPGTAGEVIAYLDAFTPLTIIGRTADNAWVQVVPPTSRVGWVMAQFLIIQAPLDHVPISGNAIDATSTVALGAPTPGAEARVSKDGDNLRLRALPGTAGIVIAYLPAAMPLDLLGRTADNAWLEANTSDGQHGWVLARYVEVRIDVNLLPVTGTAADASPTPLPTWTVVGPLQTAATATAAPPTDPPPPTAPYQPLPAGLPLDPAPFISGITGRSREIYLSGLGLGNRANVFAKVGDSLTTAAQYLSPFAISYNLRGYTYLQDIVSLFSTQFVRTGNSFANVSQAAKGGWAVQSVLSSAAGDKTVCGGSEAPLLCEYRVAKPAVAVILLGTNDVATTDSESFRTRLRQVVDLSIQNGVIPVLTTLPDYQRTCCAGRIAEMNGLITQVAREADTPLVDYWSAMQSLPNAGLSSDGIHTSAAPTGGSSDFTAANLQYGYTLRNLLSLQVLDMLWRQVMY